jgi:hypothetical protein
LRFTKSRNPENQRQLAGGYEEDPDKEEATRGVADVTVKQSL